MGSLAQDLRFAARMLAKSPGTTLAALASLALGLGANTAIFSAVNALLLEPLPVRAPGEVAAVFTSDFSGPPLGMSSYPDYVEFRDTSDAFEPLAAYALQPVGLVTRDQSARLWAEVVTGNYFELAGVAPALGRLLTPADDRESAPPVVVLGHALWKQRFGGDEAILGRAVKFTGVTATVVGVAPESYPGLARGLHVDLWAPMAMRPALGERADTLRNRGSRGLMILGRLKKGFSVSVAQARLNVVARRLHAADPERWTDVRHEPRRVTVLPERAARLAPETQGPVSGFMALLMAVVGLVLLIACANIANLLLARVAARRREIAIRLSLGAGRARIVRQFVTETMLVALLGGAIGGLVADWACDSLGAFRPPVPIPLTLEIAPDARVLGFALALSLLTGLLLGLVPAREASRADVVPALKDETASAHGHSRLRNLFVVAQVACSLVLLVGAGLFLRSLRNAAAIDPGFEPRGLVLLSADLALAGYDEARAAALEASLRDGVAGHPAVRQLAWVATLPLDPMGGGRRGLTIDGYQPEPGEDMEVHLGVVGPGYFETMGIPLLRGRGFASGDRAGAPGVVVVNESFARRYFPGRDAVGHRLSMSGDDGPWLEIVGISRDGKYVTLGEDARPFVYVPLYQDWRYVRSLGAWAPATLVARTTSEPLAAAASLHEALQSLDPSLPVYGAREMESHLRFALLPARLAGSLLGLFGAIGLVLASLGLAGVVAQAVSRRQREIGVRMAMGANARSVLRLILGEGLRPVATGMLIGLALAAGAARLVASFLYGLSPLDPGTLLGVPALLFLVATLAVYLPARRATRVDPVVALRCD